MSEVRLIDASKIESQEIHYESEQKENVELFLGGARAVMGLVHNAPTIDPASCLNWHIGKPPEHKSGFAKLKGTKRWLPGMFETVSNEVLVTLEFPDKSRIVTVSHTTDGEWTGNCKNFDCKVVAWTEKPTPAKEGLA